MALETTDSIQVRGARQHNLSNLDVDIPRDRLVVITGLSGSGKSSLAHDTIFAEGQRRYLESLSVFARQFIENMERPDVDTVDGLPPTITVAQDTTSVNPRSTVATVTEIYDYLRVLYARAGLPHCWNCGIPVGRRSIDQIVGAAMALEPGQKLMILAPIIRGRKGLHRDVMARVLREGYVRARIDTTLCDLNHPPELERHKVHTIEAVVDRVVIRDGLRQRISDSIRDALKLAEGTVILTHLDEDGWHDRIFSTKHSCPQCELSFDEVAPRNFSFNSPYGACPTCSGLGICMELDANLVIPDKNLSLEQGGVHPLKTLRGWFRQQLEDQILHYLEAEGIGCEDPIAKWPKRKLNGLLNGKGGFSGVLPILKWQLQESSSEKNLEELANYLARQPCPDCAGARLGPLGRHVTVAGKKIHELTCLHIDQARDFFADLELPTLESEIARPILDAIRNRLAFLDQVGLNYLTLDRPSSTLSGGEAQRIRLAAQIGSGIIGVCYVLDEPTIGLHQADNAQLIEALKKLRDSGNSILVIEHDEEMMLASDYVFDLGPGGGVNGGKLIATGTPNDILANPDSLTGQFLSGKRVIKRPKQRRQVDPKQMIELKRVTTNNLKGIDVTFPLGTLITVCGVSGSGKSSLVVETLAPALAKALRSQARRSSKAPARSDNGAELEALRRLRLGKFKSIKGIQQIDKVIEIDQSPIGRTPRSTPATYVGVLDHIRKVYAGTRDAKVRGYSPGRFSPNVKAGRCDRCEGLGKRKVEMHFLPDMDVTCEACRGRRFNPQTLTIRYRDKSIADVFEMSIDEAAEFFSSFGPILRRLQTMQQVGLGYISLGQSSTTLSGGEAQRVKLASELSKVSTGRTVYILDEPTTGLHFADVEKLLEILHQLVGLGNTVIVIEHNLDVIRASDYLIDMGPGAGADGGKVVACGTPEQVAKTKRSVTGKFLKKPVRK